MLKSASEEIRNCYANAETCARQAAEQTDPKLREDFLALKAAWLNWPLSGKSYRLLSGKSYRLYSPPRVRSTSDRQRSGKPKRIGPLECSALTLLYPSS